MRLFSKAHPVGRDRWVISRHAAPGRGRFLYWHPSQVYAFTNNRDKAAKFPTYGEAVRAVESIPNVRERLDIGRI